MVRPFLLDTNLLLLRLVSRADAKLLESFKRVQCFNHTDIDLLENFLGSSQIRTTPHILAEVSNFVRQAPLGGREKLLTAFQEFALEHEEVYEAAKLLAAQSGFSQFGIADTGIFSLAASSHVVTMDFRLAGKILAGGHPVTNFNHLRAVSYR